jgi:group I intron endonuclease
MKTKKIKTKKLENVIIGIYKIINPKGEIYIGQAINWDRRKEDYKWLRCKGQPKIYQSLLEYGFEAHKFIMIEKCYPSQLNQRESFHKRKIVKKLGWDKALFCKIKDGRGGECSEETKQKMRKPRYEGFREKISKINKGKPKPKGFGKKLSKDRKGKPRPEIYKAVLQYDLEGNFIKEWKCINEVGEIMGVHATSITANLIGRTKTSCGYIWKYK